MEKVYEPKSMTLFLEDIDAMRPLPPESQVAVIHAIANDIRTGEETKLDDPAAALLYRVLMTKVKRDWVKYVEKCKKNRENAKG